MKLAAKIVTGTILITLVVVFGALLLPLSAANDTWAFRSQLAVSSALALMYAGAAALFMVSLKVYKAKMRRAFTALSTGMLLTALGTMHLPIANGFHLLDSVWSKSGLIILPFLLSVLVIYIGIRGFARLVGTNTILTKASVIIPV